MSELELYKGMVKKMKDDEIKEILDYLQDKDNYIEELGVAYKRIYINNGDLNLLLDYITNLQQENERLKQNQVKVLNRIRDFINSSKCEITEGSYCDDKHSQYWKMFKQFAEELQDKIKGLDTKYYVYIPKWREQELLNQEEQLEDYKSRVEKANEFINENTELEHDGDDYGYMEWINIINMDTMTFINNLSDILNGRSDE